MGWVPGRSPAKLVLSKLNQYLLKHSAVDVSTFVAAHGMDIEDPLLDDPDVISHLMNGHRADHSTNGCAEVSRRVKSPVKMAIKAPPAFIS